MVGGGNGLDWFDSVLRYDRSVGLMGGWQELAPLQVRARLLLLLQLPLVRMHAATDSPSATDSTPLPPALLPLLLQVARGSLAAGIAGGYLFAYGGGKPNEQYNVVEW